MKIMVNVSIMPDDHLEKSERNKMFSQSHIIDNVIIDTHVPELDIQIHRQLREMLDNVGYLADRYLSYCIDSIHARRYN